MASNPPEMPARVARNAAASVKPSTSDDVKVGQKEIVSTIVRLCDRHGSTATSIGKLVAQKHGLSNVPKASIRQALMRAVKDGVVHRNEADVRFKLVSPSRLPPYLRNILFKKKNNTRKSRTTRNRGSLAKGKHHRGARHKGKPGAGRLGRRRRRRRRRPRRRRRTRRRRRRTTRRRRRFARGCRCPPRRKRRRKRKKEEAPAAEG